MEELENNVLGVTSDIQDGAAADEREEQSPAAETEAEAAAEVDASSENAEVGAKPSPKKRGPSGAYWYTATDDAELVRSSQIRTLIHVIALMLQLVILVLPQSGLEYTTKFIASYAFVYMWAVFVMIGVSIYVIIMDCTKNKLAKRIPVERAPKNGFKRRAFFTAELFIAINALMFIFELSFVCIYYDGFGLLGMFLSLAATGMAVWARIIEWMTLKDAEYIPPPEDEQE
ncbi:MAG: hypothetical protein J1G38_01100 [Clostridiales bacterium]|nr:hypothetical protein [Clostridiales bacterium]